MSVSCWACRHFAYVSCGSHECGLTGARVTDEDVECEDYEPIAGDGK